MNSEKIETTIQLNGETKTIRANSSINDLLIELGLIGKRIAVECNGEIIPKSQHPTSILQHNDRLEIVVAVGGG